MKAKPMNLVYNRALIFEAAAETPVYREVLSILDEWIEESLESAACPKLPDSERQYQAGVLRNCLDLRQYISTQPAAAARIRAAERKNRSGGK